MSTNLERQRQGCAVALAEFQTHCLTTKPDQIFLATIKGDAKGDDLHVVTGCTDPGLLQVISALCECLELGGDEPETIQAANKAKAIVQARGQALGITFTTNGTYKAEELPKETH